MICSQCQGEVPEGASTCPSCGAEVATATATAPATTPESAPEPISPGSPLLEQAPREPGAPPPPAGGGQLPKFTFDAKRWSPADRISGAATLVLLVSLFLPWFGVTFFGLSATADGLAAHGYLYVVLIICLAMLAYLVAVAGWRELPFALPGSHEQPLLIGSVVNLVLVFFGFVFKPGGSIVGWRFGAFLGLIAAIAAVVPLALPMVRSGKAAHR